MYWTHDLLRSIPEVKRTYIELYLITDFTNEMLSPYIMSVQTTLTRAVHLMGVVVIKHHLELPISFIFIFGATATIFMFTWLGSLHAFGLYHFSNSKFIRSWKQYPCPLKGTFIRKKIWKKEMKSIRPLGIRMGSYYQIKLKSVLGVASTFCRGTVRLLVALNKNPIMHK